MQTESQKADAQKISPIDKYIGARIRERRISLGISQQKLSAILGITYQQTHKYEHGFNRTSTKRLIDISKALRVAVSWFFEGFDDQYADEYLDPNQLMALELARNFALIQNGESRKALAEMARAMAAAERNN